MIHFKWHHFQKEIILLTVRWYLAYPLSYRHLEEMMLERGMRVDHSTINRWVIHYAPLFEKKFRKNYKQKVGMSWRMDETYIKIKGIWHYPYRAVDKAGNTIDFKLSKKRDESTAKALFVKAIDANGLPEKATIDKSGSNKAGLNTINAQPIIFSLLGLTPMQITIRRIKYLNNLIEQDHRSIKRITNPMMGFKAFHSAEATLVGIELHHMLKKYQHVDAQNQSLFQQFYALAA